MTRITITAITFIGLISVSVLCHSSEYSNEQLIRAIMKPSDSSETDVTSRAVSMLEKQAPECMTMLMAAGVSQITMEGKRKPASNNLARIAADVCKVKPEIVALAIQKFGIVLESTE